MYACFVSRLFGFASSMVRHQALLAWTLWALWHLRQGDVGVTCSIEPSQAWLIGQLGCRVSMGLREGPCGTCLFRPR